MTLAKEIALSKIEPNPHQPRTHFPAKEQKELEESIRQNGLIQPIVLRALGERYQILAGERRMRACRDLGFSTILAVVRTYTEEEMHTLSLLENVQREDLSPMEVAHSYRVLMSEYNYTQEKLATKLGKDRSTVANILRLLELPEEIQKDMELRKLSGAHGRALLPLRDSHFIFKLRDEIIKKQLSVRDTEKAVRTALNKRVSPDAKNNSSKSKKLIPLPPKSRDVIELEEKLALSLGSPVEIWGEHEGTIEIYFSNPQDFNRIFNLIQERESED